MPSPFPGMDPYLEDPALRPGVHDRLIVSAGDLLQPLLRPRYYAEIRERIHFEERRTAIYPDVTIQRREPDPDGVLDLPAAFARCCDRGDYGLRIDRGVLPVEPPRVEEAVWAEDLLRRAGRPGSGSA